MYRPTTAMFGNNPRLATHAKLYATFRRTKSGIIPALLEHKFNLSEFEAMRENESQHSPVMSVVLNGVSLSFHLTITALKDHPDFRIAYDMTPIKCDLTNLSVYPLANVPMIHFFLFVTDCAGQLSLQSDGKFEFASKRLRNRSSFVLPNTLEGLKSKGFIGHDSMLHTYAIILIPQISVGSLSRKWPASSAQNLFVHHLYGEVGTPTATNSPLSNRFELISKDGRHFWVHKDVLAFNSDVFKQMFDPDKPDEARFKYLREGKMTLENVSGGALKEMLSFIYLKYATPDLLQFALELLPVAEMYELKGFGLLCYWMLIGCTVNNKDIAELLRILDVSRLHELNDLEEKCTSSLKKILQKEDVDKALILRLTKQAHENGYDELKSVCQQHVNESPNLTVTIILELAAEADKYGLNDLWAACGEWFVRNWEMAHNSGQLSDVIEDKTGGLFTRSMVLAGRK